MATARSRRPALHDDRPIDELVDIARFRTSVCNTRKLIPRICCSSNRSRSLTTSTYIRYELRRLEHKQKLVEEETAHIEIAAGSRAVFTSAVT